jgi:hypothetical protein
MLNLILKKKLVGENIYKSFLNNKLKYQCNL